MWKTETGVAALLACAILLFVAARANASEPEPNEASLEAYRAFVGEGLDEGLSWPERWRTYQESKDDLYAARSSVVDAHRAHEKREKLRGQAASPEEAAKLVAEHMSEEERELADRHDPDLWDEYVRLQTALAVWIRRDRMPMGGWLMGIFAALLLWGGFALHVGIARRRGRQKES